MIYVEIRNLSNRPLLLNGLASYNIMINSNESSIFPERELLKDYFQRLLKFQSYLTVRKIKNKNELKLYNISSNLNHRKEHSIVSINFKIDEYNHNIILRG